MSDGVVDEVQMHGLQATGDGAVGGEPFGSVLWRNVDSFADMLNGNIVGAAGQSARSEKPFAGNILRPLGSFRKKLNAIVDNIVGIVGKGDITMKELIQIQYQLTQLAYMNDVSSKTADKLGQGAQTLFRNQG
ncbi:MAG: hypothetical protein LBI39_01905 [Puniceicoccales bacterium]|jgi:hypothetical protein|nr:hypothetical protein [Puniceicoccales bacterium]